MNKLGIWGIVIAAAFVVGVLSANPVVEAVGGWKAAIAGHETRITDLESQTVPPTYWEIIDMLGDQANAFCDVGDKIIGGGTTVLGGQTEVTIGEPIFNGGANSDQEGWKGGLAGGGSFQIRVSASCLDLIPLR